MFLRRIGAVLLALLLGCGITPQRIRSESEERRTVVHLPRTAGLAPVGLDPKEVSESIKRLALEVQLIGSPRDVVWRMFELDALSGDYLYLIRDRKLVPMGTGTSLDGVLTQEEEKLTSDYKGWCQRVYGLDGDCLGGALVGGRYLDLHGRYVLALALSKSPVLDELKLALHGMVSIQAVMNAALWTVGTLMMLLAMPEPVTKALAAAMTTALIFWVGVDTLYNLVTGWSRLMEEVKVATTFSELREAGERYGRVIGRDAARVFAMLAMAAIHQTAQGFVLKVQTLPGSAQAAMQADARAGLWLPAMGEVTEVAVTADGFSVALPPFAVAMAAQQGRGDWTHEHHIATIANDKSSLRGGPWTPRFREIFARAGMKLDDVANRMPVQGHKGPHPERYHRIVHARLDGATKRCRSIAACRQILMIELADLSREIATSGTELNQLVTLSQPR